MKPHHILVHTLLPAITVGLAIWLAVEYQARLKLEGEHQALEQQKQQMADLAAQNEQLSNLVAQESAPRPLSADEQMELLRLRGEVGMLRRQQSDLNQAQEENRLVHTVLEKYSQRLNGSNAATTNYWPQGSWANSGYGTPEAALQTIFWAGANGDLTNFTASIANEADTNFINSLTRGKTATEQSIQLAEETYGIKSVEILGREMADDNTVLLTVELENQDDFQTVKMVMKKDGGEWKLAGPGP